MVKKDVKEVEQQADQPATLIAESKVGNASLPSGLLDPEVLGGVSVDLTASLGQGSLTLAELANLASGVVVELATELNGTVALELNGRTIAEGELVAVGERFGVRITSVQLQRP